MKHHSQTTATIPFYPFPVPSHYASHQPVAWIHLWTDGSNLLLGVRTPRFCLQPQSPKPWLLRLQFFHLRRHQWPSLSALLGSVGTSSPPGSDITISPWWPGSVTVLVCSRPSAGSLPLHPGLSCWAPYITGCRVVPLREGAYCHSYIFCISFSVCTISLSLLSFVKLINHSIHLCSPVNTFFYSSLWFGSFCLASFNAMWNYPEFCYLNVILN